MTDSDPPGGADGLHAERTVLAWRRLALVLLGMALISARLLWPRFDAWALLPTIAIAGVATLLLVRSQRRYLARLHRSASPPDGRLALFAAAATTGTAVLWLVAVASGG